jgi:DNA-binding beta-propeller fold protein YncE
VNAALISGLSGPTGIAISEDGANLFVSNYFAGTIGKYTITGQTINESLVTGLSYPTSLAVAGDNLFVVNSGTNTIGKYSTSGTTMNTALITDFNSPTAIAVLAPEPSVFASLVCGATCILARRRRSAR